MEMKILEGTEKRISIYRTRENVWKFFFSFNTSDIILGRPGNIVHLLT